MKESIEPLMSDDLLDERLAADEADHIEETGEPGYIPDPQIVWGAEAARAMLVVLTRRLGPDFAREVHNELASRTLSYQAGCPDDQRDGEVMSALLCDRFWDDLFAAGGAVRAAAE